MSGSECVRVTVSDRIQEYESESCSRESCISGTKGSKAFPGAEAQRVKGERREMTRTSREGGNWTLAFLYILQCEACFPLETQSAVPLGNIRWRMERIGMSVCVCVNFF